VAEESLASSFYGHAITAQILSRLNRFPPILRVPEAML